MRAKKHVVVLMGGMSVEHEISLKSGSMVLDHIDKEIYKVSAIRITRDGDWVFDEETEDVLEVAEAIPRLKALHPDCVFIAMHGPYGEDGRLQGMFDILGIPYVGSGCAASALALDKIRSKRLAIHHGVPVADQIDFDHRQWETDSKALTRQVADELGFPCVLKSPRQGSSLGMAIAKQAGDFRSAVEEVFQFGYTCMVEQFVEGLELTCSVLDTDEEEGPVALPVTSIRPAGSSFFDYHAKYTPGACEEITPADIPDDLRGKVQDYALRMHAAIGCRGLSRSDMIVRGDEPIWLEINTIPGLTETSLFPQAAAAAGISFTEMVNRLVESALI